MRRIKKDDRRNCRHGTNKKIDTDIQYGGRTNRDRQAQKRSIKGLFQRSCNGFEPGIHLLKCSGRSGMANGVDADRITHPVDVDVGVILVKSRGILL